MSDQESGTNESGSDTAWEATGSFSSNGSDPGGVALSTEEPAMAGFDDRATFLADLARVMQSTAVAEQARNAEGTEQRRQVHIDAIRAREALEAEELRELAKDDIKGIDAWSEDEIKRIKLERERRIATRREQLQVRLEEHRSVVAREIEAVEAAVATYRAEVDAYFARLGSATDPVEIARQAGSRPTFPDLSLIGPDDAPIGTDFGYVAGAPVMTDTEPEATSDEGPHDDQGMGSGDVLIGVMDPEASSRPAETPWDSGVAATGEAAGGEVADGTEAPAGSEGSEEPAPVAAEARVVMPRPSGAGSWLRWPSSADRSDNPSR